MLLSAAVTAVALLGTVCLFAIGLKWLGDGIGRSELLRECEYDATSSGRQGYCVVVSRYPGTPVHSERTYLEIAPVHDGEPLDYRFSAAYPFSTSGAGQHLTIDWSRVDEQVTVTDPTTGSTITYTAEQYAGGR